MEQTCSICPRNCNANRCSAFGFCGAPKKMVVAHVSLHHGEEPCISGTNGSGTIFFSFCNLKCIFCQNDELRDGKIGKKVSPEYLASIFKRLEGMGAHNINLVSGMHYTDKIIEALKIYRPTIPIVWNTNSYESTETLEKLSKYIDIYLADLKFYSPELSYRLAKCPNYFEVASKAIKQMREAIPKDEYDGNGIMKKGVIVRHLCLPNNVEDSKQIVNYIAQNFPTTVVSLMSQYIPYGQAKEIPSLNRKLKPIEYNAVVHAIQKNHKGKIYVQDMESATEEQIPLWNVNTV